MESVGGFNYLRNLPRFQCCSSIRKRRPEYAFWSHSQLSAAHYALRVLRIECGKGAEFLSVEYSVPEIEQSLPYGCYGFVFRRVDHNLAYLVLCRDDRETVFIHLLIKFFNLRRSHGTCLLHHVLLHLRCKILLCKQLPPVIPEFIERLVEILFQPLLASQRCYCGIDSICQFHFDLVCRGCKAVQFCLSQKELLPHQVFQYAAAYISIGCISLCHHHLHF